MRALVFFTIAAIDLLVPLQIVAQQYSMQHYSVNEGLIQSDVNKIIEDHKKFIWIATNGGVSRFDGLKLINYKIPISQIAYDIEEGDRDELYVLMNDGIGLLRNDSICSFPFAQGTRLGKCRNLVFNSGKLWMITNQGLSSFDRRGFHLQLSFEGFGLNPVRFFISSNNVFWIINSDATVWLIENNKLTRFESDGRPIGIGQEIMFSKMGMVYGIHEKKRVFVDHFDQKELNHLQRVGDFWYYSSNSQVFRKKGDITELVFEAPENDLIRSLLIDNEKRIWIGTHNGFYFSNSLLFKKYLIPGKLNNEVYGIVQDNNQNLWFTSFGKGLTKSNGNSFEHLESYKNILNTDTFNTGSIKKADGNLLFPTTKGILLFNGNRFSKVAEIPSQTYEYIYEDIKNNTMFYAGEKSLVIVKGSNVKIFDNVKYHLPQIFDIIKDRNNIYRLGGEEKTVFYDGRNFLSPDISRFGYTKGLYSSVQDINGNLWFATRYGLMIYDYKTCKPVLTEDIREAVFDLKIFFGKIYFGTIKGVGLIDPERFYKKEHSVTYFDYKNGYQGEEVVRNGAIIALDSSIWIPATRGVTRFFPSGIKSISHLLPVQVETIVVSDLSGNANVLTAYDLDKNDKITLKDKYCNIEINYHCSYYSDPDGLSYKYKLENYDHDWHNVPFNVRNIKYSQLPAGYYIFKINAFKSITS